MAYPVRFIKYEDGPENGLIHVSIISLKTSPDPSTTPTISLDIEFNYLHHQIDYDGEEYTPLCGCSNLHLTIKDKEKIDMALATLIPRYLGLCEEECGEECEEEYEGS